MMLIGYLLMFLLAEALVAKSLPVTEQPNHAEDQCGSVAMFPVNDRCWKKFATSTENKNLCDRNFGELKDAEVTEDRFIGAECGCSSKARGDGYSCYGSCTKAQTAELNCDKMKLECNVDFHTKKPFCNCPFGSVKNAQGNCKPTVSNCDTCKHNCHMASKCLNERENRMAFYKCADCDPELGYEGSGKTCFNIDECAAGTHTCDSNAVCMDKDPIYDNGKKFECTCKKGWTKNPKAGTKCTPCEAIQ